MKTTDIRCSGARLYFLPVQTRTPLKFGPETLTYVTCARVCLEVEDKSGRKACGWGETPLSVQWAWPSSLSYQLRHSVMKKFCSILARKWAEYSISGHPVEIGHSFIREVLPGLLKGLNEEYGLREEPMPWLAALICCSPFDIALHDAYGKIHRRPIYETYTAEFMNEDLSHYLTPAPDVDLSFEGKHPCDFLRSKPLQHMPAWHLVGGKDPLDYSELTGDEPQDNYPVLLSDWIKRDRLKCLKVKLRGNDPDWDYDRIVRVGEIAIEYKVFWLATDFNCTVEKPEYVIDILNRLMHEHPRIYGMILYVEQPFPYDLKKYKIDVHSLSARKPLFMDESAHDWSFIKLGRKLGWTGVALKTCKTQTGALLGLCWARAHGMPVMVQDLTNPMLAQIPHVLLAAYADTIMGVETNAMQFYPEASRPEALVHPGIYQRRNGEIDLGTIKGPGFGYSIERIKRILPEPSL